MDPRTHLNYHRKLLALSLLGLNQLPSSGLKGKLNTLSWCSRCKRTVERQFTYMQLELKSTQNTTKNKCATILVTKSCRQFVENTRRKRSTCTMNNFNYLLPIKFTFLFRKQPQ